MRLVLANPHVHLYGGNVRNFLLRSRNYFKYPFILNYYLKDRNKNIAILLDGTRTSLNELGIRIKHFPRVAAYFEYLLWALINGINPFRNKIIFNITNLDPKKDIVLNFSFTTLDAFPRNNERVNFHEFKGLVFTHLTHYLRNTQQIADYIAKIPASVLVAENNLVNNKYFRHFFPQEKRVYQLPFTFAKRFKEIILFRKRINKCLAIGTCSKLGREYENFFGTNPHMHPMRHEIYSKSSVLTPYIDSYIFKYDLRKLDEIKSNDSRIVKWCKKHLPYFLLEKIVPNYLNKYFQFDIVEKYNEYKMFISPEEVIGLPSVNTFEGMACGSALIAIDDPMYKNLGLIPGFHYIVYKENDIHDLTRIIQHYQNHPAELETIARHGCDFVREHFNEESVAKTFWKDLEYFSNKFEQGECDFQCSFNP